MALATQISPVALIETAEQYPLVFDRMLHKLDQQARKAKHDELMGRRGR